MNKSTILTGVLIILLSSAPAMAGDFYALSGVQGTAPTSLQDSVLAATEGGAFCSSVSGSFGNINGGGAGGGVCLVSDSFGGVAGGIATFSVANEFGVATATFLQVTF